MQEDKPEAEEASIVEAEPVEPADKEASAKKGSVTVFLAMTLAIVAIGLAALSAWQSWQSRNDKPWEEEMQALEASLSLFREQAERERNTLTDTLADQTSRMNALENSLAEQGKLAGEVRQLNAEMDNFEQALQHLAQSKAGADEALNLVEIDYLIRLAITRAELFNDGQTAIRALSIADGHLRQLKQPRYQKTRQKLAQEIAVLEAVPVLDMAAISGQLQQLANDARSWPFRQIEDTASASEESKGDMAWWQRIGHSLKNLVSVRKSTVHDELALDPAWRSAVREQARLLLLSMVIAMQQQDTEMFQGQGEALMALISQYFDSDSGAIKHARGQLQDLLSKPLQQDLPAIGESLELFRAAMTGAGNG